MHSPVTGIARACVYVSGLWNKDAKDWKCLQSILYDFGSKHIQLLKPYCSGCRATAQNHPYSIYQYIRLAYSPSPHPCKALQSCKSVHSMQQSEMTLMLTTRTPAMDYLSIWLHNRIMELEDELPCKPGKTSGVCVHLNPIYVFNGLRRAVRDRVPPGA